MCSFSYLTASCLTVILLFAFPGTSWSQEKASLFSKSVAANAARSGRSSKYSSGGSLADALERRYFIDDFRDETVETMIWSDKREANMFSDYKAMSAIMQFRETEGQRGENFDEDWTESIAERMFWIKSAKALEQGIENSTLKETYRALAEGVRKFGDFTTVEVVSRSDGLGVKQGSKNSERLIQFKLNVSARNGLEPRLKLNDFFSVRYDPLHQDTILEYERNF